MYVSYLTAMVRANVLSTDQPANHGGNNKTECNWRDQSKFFELEIKVLTDLPSKPCTTSTRWTTNIFWKDFQRLEHYTISNEIKYQVSCENNAQSVVLGSIFPRLSNIHGDLKLVLIECVLLPNGICFAIVLSPKLIFMKWLAYLSSQYKNHPIFQTCFTASIQTYLN